MSQGIACIGTSWSHKYELLYQQYQADGLLLKPNITDAELRAVIDLSLQPDSKEALRIREQALVLKDKSTAMWSKFQSVTNRYPLFKTSSSQ
jgi:colanic acid/amylovoran biosynthesis protein